MKNSFEIYKVSISDTCQLPYTLSICSRYFSFFPADKKKMHVKTIICSHVTSLLTLNHVSSVPFPNSCVNYDKILRLTMPQSLLWNLNNTLNEVWHKTQICKDPWDLLYQSAFACNGLLMTFYQMQKDSKFE